MLLSWERKNIRSSLYPFFYPYGVYLYLYEVLGPGREELSGQGSV